MQLMARSMSRAGGGLSDRVWILDGASDSIVGVVDTRGLTSTELAWNRSRGRVYCANRLSGSMSVIRDTSPSVVAESPRSAFPKRPSPTLVRGMIDVGPRVRAVLLDIGGRKVTDLHPGANDLRALAPGVYFLREARTQAQAQAVRKVVVTR